MLLMHLNLKSGSAGRGVFTVLLIFSFITAFLIDVHSHVAHANHGRDVHVLSVVDDPPSLIDFVLDDGPLSQEDPPSQNTFKDTLHSCLGLLIPVVVSNLFQMVRSAKHVAVAQRMAHDLHTRLERPPRSVS